MPRNTITRLHVATNSQCNKHKSKTDGRGDRPRGQTRRQSKSIPITMLISGGFVNPKMKEQHIGDRKTKTTKATWRLKCRACTSTRRQTKTSKQSERTKRSQMHGGDVDKVRESQQYETQETMKRQAVERRANQYQLHNAERPANPTDKPSRGKSVQSLWDPCLASHASENNF